VLQTHRTVLAEIGWLYAYFSSIMLKAHIHSVLIKLCNVFYRICIQLKKMKFDLLYI
jgi:hypothetical protein